MSPFEELIAMVMSGVTVAIILLTCSTPDRLRLLGEIHFIKLDGWRPLSPNWLTLWGLLVTLVGFGIYLADHSITGFAIIVAGAVMDRLDGKMAEALGKKLEMKLPLWNQMNFPGKTNLGEVLDPLADKLRFLPIVTYAALRTDLIDLRLIIAMWVLEVLSTCMRPPFRFLDRWVSGRGATGFGKLKVATQWLTLILWAPFHQGWLQENGLAVNVTMGAAVLFGAISVLSRLRPLRRNHRVDAVIARTTKEFGHNEKR